MAPAFPLRRVNASHRRNTLPKEEEEEGTEEEEKHRMEVILQGHGPFDG
jgi:hypothetical protein